MRIAALVQELLQPPEGPARRPAAGRGDHIDKYEAVTSASDPVWVKGKVTEHLSSIMVEAGDVGMAG